MDTDKSKIEEQKQIESTQKVNKISSNTLLAGEVCSHEFLIVEYLGQRPAFCICGKLIL